MAEEMAIIDGIDIGMRDCGTPVMWFGLKMLHGAAFNVVSWKEAATIIKKSGYYSFKKLDGKPCVVETTGNQSRFVRMLDEKNK